MLAKAKEVESEDASVGCPSVRCNPSAAVAAERRGKVASRRVGTSVITGGSKGTSTMCELLTRLNANPVGFKRPRVGTAAAEELLP